jgi:transcription antitermination protein NusB
LSGTDPAKRRRARELALQALYAIDISGEPAASCMEAVFREQHAEGEEREYAVRLVEGTIAERPAIDAELERLSESWSLVRMAAVDRNLLRLAAYELLHHAEVPRKVVINEAVEIAKRFGDQKSPSFVNALLDKLGRGAASDAGGSGEPAAVEATVAEEPHP